MFWLVGVGWRTWWTPPGLAEKCKAVLTNVFFLNYNKALAWQTCLAARINCLRLGLSITLLGDVDFGPG